MDEIVHYGGEIKPDHRWLLTHESNKRMLPGKPGIKIQKQEKLTPPVDGVTKYGPVDGVDCR